MLWVDSGQVLRCEVKLGTIARLEILTHLRQFYVDEYQHLHIVVIIIPFHSKGRLTMKKATSLTVWRDSDSSGP